MEVTRLNIQRLIGSRNRNYNVNVLCFTGRRPKDLTGYKAQTYISFVDRLQDLLYEEYYQKRNVRIFISGGAQGFDQLAFWTVEHMKRRYGLKDIDNIVYAVKGQSDRWKDTGCFSVQEYDLMLEKADWYAFVSGGSIQALMDRNHYMVDDADYVLGLYPDESWETSKGGTAECLRYAKKNEKALKGIARLSYHMTQDCLYADTIKHYQG